MTAAILRLVAPPTPCSEIVHADVPRGVEAVSTATPVRQVWVFFYGSYMNPHVLRDVGLVPRQVEVARLAGFDIVIRPLANLVRSDQHSVYGIVATATHEELSRLYSHARDVLGGTYQPEAVITETREGKLRPALCYIASSMEAGVAADDYIDRIVAPAKEFGFPSWYIERLEGYRSSRQ